MVGLDIEEFEGLSQSTFTVQYLMWSNEIPLKASSCKYTNVAFPGAGWLSSTISNIWADAKFAVAGSFETKIAKFSALDPIEVIIYLSASLSYKAMGSPISCVKKFPRLVAGVAGEPSKLNILNEEFHAAI